MDTFETLFGVKTTDVKNTCVLLPLLSKNIVKQFGVPRLSRGTIYSAGNSAHFTLIRTGVGSALAGDVVLYLTDTQCRTVILFGSCGLVDSSSGVQIGDLLSPGKCYAAESFTRLLEGNSRGWGVYYPDRNLNKQLLNAEGAGDIRSATCLSIGSLRLQDAMRDTIKRKAIAAVDMECASVFAAAAHTGLRAVALLYVTDIIGEKSYHAELNREDGAVLTSSIRNAVRILCEFIEKKLSDWRDLTRS
jgi:purine-nucleoside phosphorylase